MKPFGRLITAMVTPFDADDAVDYPRAAQLARALVDSGTESIVVAGSTGEGQTLSAEEKLRLFESVKSAVRDSAAVIAGTCTNDTAESVRLSRAAVNIGVDGILATVPWYNKPPQAGLERHFRTIADSVEAPILLYNIPSRTATNMLAETTIRLSDVPNIVGIKEASSNLDAIGIIIRDSRSDFLVWSGNDSETLPIMAIGGYGVVSVASHLVGRQIATMMSCIADGDLAGASRIHQHLSTLFGALFVMTNPIPLKYGLRQVGFPCGGLRLPLIDIDPKSAAAMDAALDGVEIDLPTAAAV